MVHFVKFIISKNNRLTHYLGANSVEIRNSLAMRSLMRLFCCSVVARNQTAVGKMQDSTNYKLRKRKNSECIFRKEIMNFKKSSNEKECTPLNPKRNHPGISIMHAPSIVHPPPRPAERRSFNYAPADVFRLTSPNHLNDPPPNWGRHQPSQMNGLYAGLWGVY